jgi:hypothetical protein
VHRIDGYNVISLFHFCDFDGDGLMYPLPPPDDVLLCVYFLSTGAACASRSEEDVLAAANASCDNRVLAVWTSSVETTSKRNPDDHLKKAGQASNLSDKARRWLALAHLVQTTPEKERKAMLEKCDEKDIRLVLPNGYRLKMDNEGSPVRFVRLDEEGYTYLVRARLIASIKLTPLSYFFLRAQQINRLVKRMPTALKGVVTESGPGPVAPNYSDGSTDSPLQFKHPQTATDCNGKTETKFTARFQRNRVNGGKSVQLSTSADKWSVTLGQFYSFCEHCFADPMWTVIKNASDKLDDGYSERKIVPIPAARDRAERWPAAMSQDEKDEEQTEQRRLDGQKHTSVAQRARNFVAWGAKLSGMGRESLPVPGHKVHAYDMERFFVKPWTAGCGMGVALMTNASPIQCEVMISHAWGEDMESLYTTLKLHEQQQNPSDFNTNTRIWFCLFGLYQGAGAAPFWLRLYVHRIVGCALYVYVALYVAHMWH